MKKVVLIFVMALFGAISLKAQSVAHVNREKILDTMPSQGEAAKEIENFERRAIAELQETQEKLQRDFQKLQEEKSTMSPTAYKFEENRLNKKYQEFQQRQQELDQQIQILSQEVYEPILERARIAIETVAKAEKVEYVLDQTSPAMLYGGGRDLTNKVITEVLKMEREAATAEKKD